MKKSIELDKLIAEHVFKNKYKAFDLVHKEHGVFIDEYMWYLPFSPTSDANLAVEVMETLASKAENEFWIVQDRHHGYAACFDDDYIERLKYEEGETFGASICKAALRHLGVKYDDQ